MTDRRDEERRAARLPRVAVWALAAAAAGTAGLAAVYGMGGFGRNDVEAACRPALATVRRIAPLARGEVAAVTVAEQPRPVPDLTFLDGSGIRKTRATKNGQPLRNSITWKR